MSAPIHHFDIERMIAEESDQKMRILLMLVNTFNQNLAQNTSAVENLGIKFDEHLTKFEARAAQDDALKNQGKGAYKIIAWVIGVVQVIGLGIWAEAKADINGIHESLISTQLSGLRIEGRLNALEAKK